MVPSTLGAVTAFLFLVAPGIAFELLRQRTRPPRAESVFIEISRVLLTGLLFSSAAVCLLVVIQAVGSSVLIHVDELLPNPNRYLAGHLNILGISGAAQLLESLLFAIIANDLLTRTPSRRVTDASTWHVLFSRLHGTGIRAFLSVQLRDGTTYTGYQAEYSTETDPTKRELALSAPIMVRAAEETTGTELPASWQRFWIGGADIATIAVSYVGTPQPRPVRLVGRIVVVVRWHLWQFAAIGVILIAAILMVA